MFASFLTSVSASFIAYASDSKTEHVQQTRDDEHFLQKMKNEKSCGVCRAPDTLASLKSLITNTKVNPDGSIDTTNVSGYGLPRKRKMTRPANYSHVKYIYTSPAITSGYHLGNVTDYHTFGVARRWLVNRLLNAPKVEVSHIARYSPTELTTMRDYWDNPDTEEYEIDYRIPMDPEQREMELGTATENNVKILLHDDGSISPLHCPTTYEQLSQGTWTYLHTMAAYYPEDPTPELKAGTEQFFHTFAQLYPCEYCKDHLIEYLQKFPVTAANNSDLSMWMCNYHNDVNARLGKRIVNCDPGYLLDRYKNGYDAMLGVSCENNL